MKSPKYKMNVGPRSYDHHATPDSHNRPQDKRPHPGPHHTAYSLKPATHEVLAHENSERITALGETGLSGGVIDLDPDKRYEHMNYTTVDANQAAQLLQQHKDAEH